MTAERLERATLSTAPVTAAEELESLAGDWDELVRAMPRPSPFLLHGWVCEWWRHLAGSSSLAVTVARRGGRLVGIAPMIVERRRGLRVVRFLGGREAALADLMLAAGEGEETALALLGELRRQRFDLLDLFGPPCDGVLRRVAPSGLHVVERVEAPVLLMPEGWDSAYSAKTSSRRRNLHRRRLRQLQELGPVEFTVARTLEELEPLLEEAFRLHALRWRGRPDGSTFGTPQGRRFHRAALRRVAADDVLRIVALRVGGRAVAFHYYFALGDSMYVHRLAFDPDLGRYSPGLLTTLETLRAASEEGLVRVEFLGGGERYKLELADRLEPLGQAIGLARSPLGAFAARQRLAGIRLRKALKRSDRLRQLYLSGIPSIRLGRASEEAEHAS